MSNRIKRTNDELKADRPTFDEVGGIPRLPILRYALLGLDYLHPGSNQLNFFHR